MADARVGTTPFWFRFLDWPPERGGTAMQTTSDTWLYVFQVHDKASRLCEEALLRAATKSKPEWYFRVDLARHKGKDKRPYVEPGADSLWLDDDGRHVLDNLRYYILCSPFQLVWPRIAKLADNKDPTKFHKLASEERGLRMVLLNEQNTKPGPGGKIRIKAIWSPWGQAMALQSQLHLQLCEWKRRSTMAERQQWRALLASIDMVNRGRELRGLLDETERKRIYGLLLEDDQLFSEVEQAAAKVVDFLKSPAMLALDLDVQATKDPAAHEEYARIKEVATRKLNETQVGRKYLREWFEEHHDLVIFDAAAAIKVTRKLPKAIFAWAKSWADVAAGCPSSSKKARQVPRALVSYARKQARLFADVHLVADTGWFETVAEENAKKALTETEFAEWKQRRMVVDLAEKPAPAWAAKLESLEPVPMKFSKESVAELKAAVSENPKLTGLFALVDAVNVAFTLRALFDGIAKDDSDKLKRGASAASGICSFLSSTLALAKSGTTHLSAAEIADLQKNRALSWEAHDLLSTYEAQGSLRRGMARVASARALSVGLGALGALAETVAYGTEMASGLHEAKTGDSPDRIWLWPGLGAVGSVAACAGYCLFFANPVGAVLIAAGSILSAVGTAGSVFWPGLVTADIDKWLMHSFVGKHRLDNIDAAEPFTKGKTLAAYHRDLDLQISALDYVLFDFTPTCELYTDNGHRRLKLDVGFRQLRCRSKVQLKLFGCRNGRWTELGGTDDWRPKGAPPEDARTRLRLETHARFLEGIPAQDYEAMKIAVQIDLLGDGSFLYPPRPKEAVAK